MERRMNSLDSGADQSGGGEWFERFVLARRNSLEIFMRFEFVSSGKCLVIQLVFHCQND